MADPQGQPNFGIPSTASALAAVGGLVPTTTTVPASTLIGGTSSFTVYPRPNYCPNCGTKIGADWNYCGQCGRAVYHTQYVLQGVSTGAGNSAVAPLTVGASVAPLAVGKDTP